MTLDYAIELDYGDSLPDDDTEWPTQEDVADWIREGMRKAGLNWVEVKVKEK